MARHHEALKHDHDSRFERFALIGQVSSGLAHELNGPVGIALGFNELARELIASSGDGFISPANMVKLKEYLSLTESANIRARTLARRISAFAKLTPGTVTDFDLIEAIDEAASLAAPAVKNYQIETARRTKTDSPVNVRADRALTVTTFVKLFLSSPEALPGGGTVIWDAIQNGRSGDRQVAFILSAEPWGTAPSAAWPVPADIRQSFTSSGGTIGPSVSRKQSPASTGVANAAHIWELPGWLPAASEYASGIQDHPANETVHKQVSAGRQAKSRRQSAAK